MVRTLDGVSVERGEMN